MIIITFEEKITFPRSKFKNLNDFFIYAIENYNITSDKVEFWILEEYEKTSSLLEKVKKAKSSQIHFNNI